MSESADFGAAWRARLASGSKPASRTLATALREGPEHVPAIAALTRDPHTNVRVGALRALADIAAWKPALVAPHAREVIEGLASAEADAQEASLEALGHIARLAPPEAALALPLIAEVWSGARRASVREAAARCLGRIGSDVPTMAPRAADRLAHALRAVKGAKGAQEAREILAAIEDVLPNLPHADRAALVPRVQPLRAHPNLQVRERAGRIARELSPR